MHDFNITSRIIRSILLFTVDHISKQNEFSFVEDKPLWKIKKIEVEGMFEL